MKRYFLTAALLLVGVMVFAQIDDDSPMPPSVDEIDVDVTEPAEIEYTGLKKAEKDFEKATDQLQKANEAYNEARQNYKEAENELGQARIEFRNARRGLNEAKKQDSPVRIERYAVNINPVLEEMSRGTQYGYSTFLEGSAKGGVINVLSKNAESEFKKYLSQYSAQKVKRQKGELFFDDILIPQIRATTMDVFVDFVKESNGVQMVTYFNMGDEFLNGTEISDEDDEVRRLLDTFARNMRYMELENQLKEQEKEFERIQKDIQKSQKDAERARESITKEEAAVVEAIADQEAAEILLEQQQDQIELTRMKLQKVN